MLRIDIERENVFFWGLTGTSMGTYTFRLIKLVLSIAEHERAVQYYINVRKFGSNEFSLT